MDACNMRLPTLARCAVVVLPRRLPEAAQDPAIGHQLSIGALVAQAKQLLLQRLEFRNTCGDVSDVPVE